MGPTFVQINHSHLLHNFNLIRKAVKPAKIMAVVKANAYGHGSIEIAKTLQENNVEYLGVAFPEEGIVFAKGWHSDAHPGFWSTTFKLLSTIFRL